MQYCTLLHPCVYSHFALSIFLRNAELETMLTLRPIFAVPLQRGGPSQRSDQPGSPRNPQSTQSCQNRRENQASSHYLVVRFHRQPVRSCLHVHRERLVSRKRLLRTPLGVSQTNAISRFVGMNSLLRKSRRRARMSSRVKLIELLRR